MKQYPEHEKIDSTQLDTIDNFYQFLVSEGYKIDKMSGYDDESGDFIFKRYDHQRGRERFFGADPEILEEERLDMIKTHRELNP